MRAEDLQALFDGAASALVLLPENVADENFVENRAHVSRAIRDALRASPVEHVVALSAVGAAHPDAPGPPGGLYGFERDLAELEGRAVLVLRSAAYMDYLLAALPLIEAQGLNGSAVRAGVRFPMVATSDVAHEAAERLRLRDFTSHEIKLLLGPADVTMSEATHAIGVRLGLPALQYVEFPPEAVRGALMSAGMSEQVAALMVDVQLAWNDGRYFDGIERTPESATPTGLDDFLNQALAAAAPTR